MASYRLFIFLVTEVSATRVANMLLGKGYTVVPNSRPKGSEHVQIAFTRGSDRVSSAMSVIIRNAPDEESEASSAIRQGMQELEIPYYGSVLLPDNGTNGGIVGCGFMPQIKPRQTLSCGPYRTNGTVIPFAQKDDGIIHDK